MDCSTPDLPSHHQLPELAQTHAHWVSDAIQPSHPLSSPAPPAFNLSQHQGLFQCISSLHQVAKVLELQFRISPSNEYSGLISFRIDSFDLLVSLGYNFSVAALTNSYCYSVTQMGHRAMLAAKALLERQFPCLFLTPEGYLHSLAWAGGVCVCVWGCVLHL